MSNQAGKGSDPRPVNKKKYDANFDQIDWNKEKKTESSERIKKCKKIYIYR